MINRLPIKVFQTETLAHAGCSYMPPTLHYLFSFKQGPSFSIVFSVEMKWLTKIKNFSIKNLSQKTCTHACYQQASQNRRSYYYRQALPKHELERSIKSEWKILLLSHNQCPPSSVLAILKNSGWIYSQIIQY